MCRLVNLEQAVAGKYVSREANRAARCVQFLWTPPLLQLQHSNDSIVEHLAWLGQWFDVREYTNISDCDQRMPCSKRLCRAKPEWPRTQTNNNDLLHSCSVHTLIPLAPSAIQLPEVRYPPMQKHTGLATTAVREICRPSSVAWPCNMRGSSSPHCNYWKNRDLNAGAEKVEPLRTHSPRTAPASPVFRAATSAARASAWLSAARSAWPARARQRWIFLLP